MCVRVHSIQFYLYSAFLQHEIVAKAYCVYMPVHTPHDRQNVSMCITDVDKGI